MVFGSFQIFKQRKARGFRYEPLYYKGNDESVESKNTSTNEVTWESNPELRRMRMRDSMESRWRMRNAQEAAAKSRRKVITFIIATVFIIVVALMYL